MMTHRSDDRPDTLHPAPAVARPLVPLTLALMSGIAAPAWGLSLPRFWLAAALVGLGAGLGWCRWQRRPVRGLPLVWFFLLGIAFYQQTSQPDFPAGHVTHLPVDQTLTLYGHLDRPARLGEEQVFLYLEAAVWQSPWGWRPAAGKVLVAAPGLERPPVGTAVVVRGRLQVPEKLQNPGTFDRPRYLAADGIFREMRLADPRYLVVLATTASPWGERLRGGIRERLRSLDPVCRAFYLAMLLGDQGEITQEMRRNFARTGTSHLLVINGLHLGMVAAVTYFLCFWLLRRFPWLLLRINAIKAATLVSVFPVVAYAWVAGGSPSTQRAEIMVLAYLLVVFLGRPGEVWSALALAALVILSLAPLRLFAISFQLSFVAVAALLYLVPRWVRPPVEPRQEPPVRDALKRVQFRVKEWGAVSLAATLATAPLVAAYFQVVSLLGFLVNLAAIPLVLAVALPLGEAAVFAQAAALPQVAQLLLALGKIPLGAGYLVIQWGARIPGSAVIMSTPTWLQIGAYYLILILVWAPRRTILTWAGAGLAALGLAGSALYPLAAVPQALEITCLDAHGGLRAVLVSPEDRRLVVSAAAPLPPGRAGPGWGPLPGYCHWRQFRRLDLVLALNLSEGNARELLTLAEQFQVGSFWFGRRGREGPGYWDLWNFLGDRGTAPRSLTRGPPPGTLGSVVLSYLELGEDAAPALQVDYQGRRVLLLPPVRTLGPEDLPLPPGALEALILPGDLAAPRERQLILARLQPRMVVLYGDPVPAAWPVPCRYTREGAVSLYLGPGGVTIRQRRS
jgi:competence protein ComEC